MLLFLFLCLNIDVNKIDNSFYNNNSLFFPSIISLLFSSPLLEQAKAIRNPPNLLEQAKAIRNPPNLLFFRSEWVDSINGMIKKKADKRTLKDSLQIKDPDIAGVSFCIALDHTCPEICFFIKVATRDCTSIEMTKCVNYLNFSHESVP